MPRVIGYLTDPSVEPSTRTCRVKAWAHDNAFTLIWLHLIEIVLLIVLVLR